MRLVAPAFLLVSACIDTRLVPKRTDTATDETASDAGDGWSLTQPPRTFDPCNGLDDDADGLVDEDAQDADGDGVADCLDDSCALAAVIGEPVEVDAACGVAPGGGDPADATLMWELRPEVFTACERMLVARLDGPTSDPDILCARSYEGVYRVEGSSGTVVARYDALDGEEQFGIADVDADGDVEIVGFDDEGHAVGVRPSDGSTKWVSPAVVQAWGRTAMNALAIADIDGDGVPEVLTPRAVISGRDGSTLLHLDWDDESVTSVLREILAVDLDQSPPMEAVTVWWARDLATGAIEWEAPKSDDWWGPVTMLPLQADDDDAGEVAYISMVEYLLVDSDGTELARVRHPEDQGEYNQMGPACAGDLLGDGSMAVVIEWEDGFRAYAADGTRLWYVPGLDESTYTTCTTFDFDGDGADEVLVADQEHFAILDGRDGSARFEDWTYGSVTVGDFAAVVDLDGDGSAEIVVSGGYTRSFPTGVPLRVYTSARGNWPPGGAWWPSSDWSGTSLQSDGSVPRTAAAPWVKYGHWRAQPESFPDGIDLAVSVVGACATRCEGGQVDVSVQVTNRGPLEATPEQPVAIYTDADPPRLLEVTHVPKWIDDGWSSDSFIVSLTTEQALAGVVLVAGDDGTGVRADECDESDNRLEWRWEGCDDRVGPR